MNSMNISDKKNILYLGLLAIAYIVIIFYVILPLIKKNGIETSAVKAAKSSLNYVMLYSSKIDMLKKAEKLNNHGNNNHNNYPRKINPAGKSGKGFLKYFKTSLAFFGISKKNIAKFYASYNAGGENVTVSLKGVSLNKVVDVIYFLSNSGYNTVVKSLKIKRNFNDGKTLDFDAGFDLPNKNGTKIMKKEKLK